MPKLLETGKANLLPSWQSFFFRLLLCVSALSLSSCRHSRGNSSDDTNSRVPVIIEAGSSELIESQWVKESQDDGSRSERVSIDLDMPLTPVYQLWQQKAPSFSLHRSGSCPEAIEDASCENEAVYFFERASKLLTLNSCRCGKEAELQKKLSQAESQEIDRLMEGLRMLSSPSQTCEKASPFTWEIIVRSIDGVEQGYPSSPLCSAQKPGSVEFAGFQSLFRKFQQHLPLAD